MLSACALGPTQTEDRTTFALTQADRGELQAYSERIDSQLAADESAFWLVDGAKLAMDVRLALIDGAVSSLDIQSFIWEPDSSGRLLQHRLVMAADRGVRVRLLLDDMTLLKKESYYVALDSHPNIEVRTFNPWTSRSPVIGGIEYLGRKGLLDHRMHIKSIVADNSFVLIGGRNIGNRYFGIYEEFVQNDLDIMAAGPMVGDASLLFDDYWNSPSSYPVQVVTPRRQKQITLSDYIVELEETYTADRAALIAYPLEPADWSGFWMGLVETLVAAPGLLVYDESSITEQSPVQLYEPFKELIASAREEVLIATAYLIPDQEFVDLLAQLVDRGVRVVVLTNSLATNNHTVAHTGYRHWRRRVLETGIELYESRQDAQSMGEYTVPPTVSGRMGYHSKAVVVDRERSFVGSPNIDPRSMILNAEVGFFVDSPVLAEQIVYLVERDIRPQNAWRATIDEDGGIRWTGNSKTLTRQPARGFLQRVTEFFVNLLPLKGLA